MMVNNYRFVDEYVNVKIHNDAIQLHTVHEIELWLIEHVGEPDNGNWVWYVNGPKKNQSAFAAAGASWSVLFLNEADAIMFKLRFKI